MGISLHLAQPETRRLSLDLRTTEAQIRGLLAVDQLALGLDGDAGEIGGSRVTVEDFQLRTGDLVAEASVLTGREVTIGWGAAGLRVEASSLSAPEVSVTSGGVHLVLRDLLLEDVQVRGADISVGRGSATSIAVSARLDQGRRAVNPEPEDSEFDSTASASAFDPALYDGVPLEEASPGRVSPGGMVPEAVAPQGALSGKTDQVLFDWHLLDGLRGEFNVDLEVDLTVPVIGRRRATHCFRIAIEDGALDYTKLEKDLSTLENAFLDFAVRPDGTLVLERGIPLLPTRGRGKPILIWRLDAADLQLAHAHRIRLAVLPHFEAASADSSSRPAQASTQGSSPIALRSLTLGNLETRLQLPQGPAPTAAALSRLSFGELTLQAELHHDLGQSPRPGTVRGILKDLDLGLGNLPVGPGLLSLERLRLASISTLEGRFTGLTPTEVTCTLNDLRFDALSLRGQVSSE
jgi:hypothetical protein